MLLVWFDYMHITKFIIYYVCHIKTEDIGKCSFHGFWYICKSQSFIFSSISRRDYTYALCNGNNVASGNLHFRDESSPAFLRLERDLKNNYSSLFPPVLHPSFTQSIDMQMYLTAIKEASKSYLTFSLLFPNIGLI